VQQACSLPLGCVRLTSVSSPTSRRVSPEARTAIADHTRPYLERKWLSLRPREPRCGVYRRQLDDRRAIAGLAEGKPLPETAPIVTVATLTRILDHVAALPLVERRKQIAGLPAARADVFPAALATMNRRGRSRRPPRVSPFLP